MKKRGVSAGAVLGAMGIVYGDIGTSPLYALRDTIAASGGMQSGGAIILGSLSLIFWSLLILVTLKYVILIMRADNEGEGGVLSLFALVLRQVQGRGAWVRIAVTLAALGAALFYCDALITPAMSVLSAVEGLEIMSPSLSKAVVPVTMVIIGIVFAIQRGGTEKIGRMFGPVMLIWFVTLAVLGIFAIARNPVVFVALDPRYGVQMLWQHTHVAFAILGGVFLTLTGGEALYADMGHFGRGPVRAAWFGAVWPSLLLNYFGQGALMLADPGAIDAPLFAMVPRELLGAFVLLATLATIIASQATITGAFSVTRQAIQLDLLPRLRILQTSAHEASQIFVPVVNISLFLAVLLFVAVFKSSAALGAAYGAAVSGTMLITSVLGSMLAFTLWKWSIWRVSLIFAPLALLDVLFFTANLTKFADGAWIPLLLALGLFGIFMVWRSGRLLLRAALRQMARPFSELPDLLAKTIRVPGTAVFLASDPRHIPTALLRNLEHNHVIHERLVFLNMEIVRSPRQDPADRVRVETLLPEVYLITARFGFMETPDVSEALRQCRARSLKLFAQDCSFFLGWHLVAPRPRGGYSGLRNNLFAWMQRRSTQAAEFFRMPEKRVIVLATQVEL